MITQTRIIMGMPVTLAIVDAVEDWVPDAVFAFFEDVDARFSTYRADSEISRFNRGEISEEGLSAEARRIFALARATSTFTMGYFDMSRPDGSVDPSGIVKGWAIKMAADMLRAAGAMNFYVDAGGDVQTSGACADGTPWRVGIRSPFHLTDIIKVVTPGDNGVATSGTSIRGAHIWNPHAPEEKLDDVVSITVIGPDIVEADCLATAAFAMGRGGVDFIEGIAGFEAYQVNAQGRAVMTSGFRKHVVQ